jgi:hypothetical protein
MVTRDICGPGWVYSVRFGDRDVWKIGHTNDVRTRLSELNKHIPYEVLGERWTVFRTHKWATPELAYAMEQRILTNLAKHRTTGERVRCSETELAEVWKNSITNQFERA